MKTILIIAATALMSIFGSFALIGANGITRDQVQVMQQTVETRQAVQMDKLEAQIVALTTKIEQLVTAQVRTETKLDAYLKKHD